MCSSFMIKFGYYGLKQLWWLIISEVCFQIPLHLNKKNDYSDDLDQLIDDSAGNYDEGFMLTMNQLAQILAWYPLTYTLFS